MSKNIRVIAKFKQKNRSAGNYFFLYDGVDVDFAYKATERYQPGSVAVYNQNFYLRNTKVAGYNPGVLPTDTEFWIPGNPGRDLRHWPTQADLEAEYPAPQEGSFASVGDDKAFLLYTAGAWEPISGSSGKELFLVFDSDLDTVSTPLTMQGVIENIAVVLPVELASYSFETKLNAAGASYVQHADIAALLAWINTNVVDNTVSWILRVIVGYDTGYSGEVTLKFTYDPVL